MNGDGGDGDDDDDHHHLLAQCSFLCNWQIHVSNMDNCLKNMEPASSMGFVNI